MAHGWIVEALDATFGLCCKEPRHWESLDKVIDHRSVAHANHRTEVVFQLQDLEENKTARIQAAGTGLGRLSRHRAI